MPGGPGRGPPAALVALRRTWSSGARGEPRRSPLRRVPPRPLRDRRRAGRDAHRDPHPDPPGGGSAYEKVERRAGDWAVAAAGAAVWLDQRRRRAPTSASASPPSAPSTHRAAEAEAFLRGQGPPPRTTSPRRPASPARTCNPTADQRGPVDYKRHLARELTARALRRAVRPGAGRGGLTDMQITVTVNGDEHTRDVEPRLLLVHFLRDELRPDRHPLGLRHVQLRRLHGLARRRAGQVAARCSPCMADGHEVRTVEGLEPRRRARPGPAGLHASATACSAASARPGMMMTARALLDREPAPDEQRDPRGDLRQPLPLHGLREHRRARSAGPPSTQARRDAR